jgi:glycosyltransferase involved in cell wall biosynthesis
MRVLWFTPTLSLGANYLNSKAIGGGWIESLEAELNKIPLIQIGISFNLNNNDVKPFSVGNTMYYPVNITRSKSKLRERFSRWSHSIGNENNIQKYLEIIQQYKPDLIHIFGTESDFGLVAAKTTVPCIIYLQGNLTVINRKWFSGLTAVDILKYSNKWVLLKGQGLYHDYFLNKKGADREKKLFKACKYFIGRTDWDRRISSVLSPGSKYFHCDEIMRPGFYFNQWQPQIKQTDFVIVSTIRNNIYKGLETIYETKKILNLNFPEYKVIWKIAGIKDKEEILYLIERKFKDRLIDNNIQLLGPLQENELIRELLMADLFVHASHIENSPNSVCEAMLLGMPVIATYAGGTPGIIRDKKEGLLVQDGDPYALAGAIIELYRDRELANKLGEQARITSLIRNDPKKIVNDLLNIYSSILKDGETNI